jgi:hypothetical protein
VVLGFEIRALHLYAGALPIEPCPQSDSEIIIQMIMSFSHTYTVTHMTCV